MDLFDPSEKKNWSHRFGSRTSKLVVGGLEPVQRMNDLDQLFRCFAPKSHIFDDSDRNRISGSPTDIRSRRHLGRKLERRFDETEQTSAQKLRRERNELWTPKHWPFLHSSRSRLTENRRLFETCRLRRKIQRRFVDSVTMTKTFVDVIVTLERRRRRFRRHVGCQGDPRVKVAQNLVHGMRQPRAFFGEPDPASVPPLADFFLLFFFQ